MIILDKLNIFNNDEEFKKILMESLRIAIDEIKDISQ